MSTQKILWIVHYDSLDDLLARAVNMGVTGVAIRTDNDIVQAITAFHDQGMEVFGWRWPSAQRASALHEANNATSLFNQGLDGYYIDVEGAAGQPWDWNQAGLTSL